MEYKKYDIVLNDEGKIACRELGIVGDTVEEVKAAIRATEVKQAAKPKINVLYKDVGWFSGGKTTKFLDGTTTGRVTTNKYERVWLTYTRRDGKQKREKVDADSLFLNTQENREIAEKIEALSQQREDISSQIGDLQHQMTKL